MYSEKSRVLTVLRVLGGGARHDERLNQEEKRMSSPRRVEVLCESGILGVFVGDTWVGDEIYKTPREVSLQAERQTSTRHRPCFAGKGGGGGGSTGDGRDGDMQLCCAYI